MDDEPKPPDNLYFLRWTYYSDGTSDPAPLPKPEPSQEPRELIDIDKYIAESEGIYKFWWMKWKQWYPERCLIREEVKEPVIKPPAKPNPTFTSLTCKRCNHIWTPRAKQPPVQCPKCHSPYWNRETKKK